VEGLSEALALEVKPLGPKVTIVEPGGFPTDWAFSPMVFCQSDRGLRSDHRFVRERLGNNQGLPNQRLRSSIN
jgi:NAD(P)-dependent dehydrogenase (short-subunit alcohol dehydrogenase family)